MTDQLEFNLDEPNRSMSRTENPDDEKERKKSVPTVQHDLHMGVAKIFATDVEWHHLICYVSDHDGKSMEYYRPPVESIFTSSRQRPHLVF
jgi:hypothetical protein